MRRVGERDPFGAGNLRRDILRRFDAVKGARVGVQNEGRNVDFAERSAEVGGRHRLPIAAVDGGALRRNRSEKDPFRERFADAGNLDGLRQPSAAVERFRPTRRVVGVRRDFATGEKRRFEERRIVAQNLHIAFVIVGEIASLTVPKPPSVVVEEFGAGIDENGPRDAVGSELFEVRKKDGAAHRVPDEANVAGVEAFDQRAQVGGGAFDAEIGRKGRPSVSAMIEGDRSEGTAKTLDYSVGRRDGAAEPVDIKEEPPFPDVDVSDFRAVVDRRRSIFEFHLSFRDAIRTAALRLSRCFADSGKKADVLNVLKARNEANAERARRSPRRFYRF